MTIRHTPIRLKTACGLLLLGCATAAAAPDVFTAFRSPSEATRPWTYWLWENSCVDDESIRGELADIRRLGFGAVLLSDSRGYWDDEDHVVKPKPKVAWGSDAWLDLVAQALREAARQKLQVAINVAASGGHLKGDWDTGADGPKFLYVRRYLPGEAFESPDLPNYRDITVFAVRTAARPERGGWELAGDGFFSMEGNVGKREAENSTFAPRPALESRELATAADGRFFTRGIVSASRIYGSGIASIEAFTHMHRHWSVDPAFLKPLGDIAFALGINRFVWHTYTASPRAFGVPGLEYFAGSHINRNVTWNRELPAFVAYLHRCQELLQRGKPVTDVALLCGDRPYAGWGYPKNGYWAQLSSWEEDVRVPKGYASDLVNDEALKLNPDLLKSYALVHDCRPAAARGGTVKVGALKPDVETATDWLWCHRRDADADWYFVAGEGAGDLVLRTTAPAVFELDPVTGEILSADAERTADGRTRVTLELPVGGSRFVVFAHRGASPSRVTPRRRETAHQAVTGPWQVSFAYAEGISAAPPAPVTLPQLVDFRTRDDLKHFSGTATYRTTFQAAAPAAGTRLHVRIGELPSGLARIAVNGTDCGVVWCAPWSADVTAAMKAGENTLEIRYVNNWSNRLIGYSSSDPLQESGVLGPVEIRTSR